MDDRTDRFRAIFDVAYTPLLAYARRRCGQDGADDLVAEVLAVAWRRLDDVPEDAPLPWLYGVARRTLLNRRRSLERRARLALRLRLERSRDVTESTDHVVLEALHRLRPADREVLRLAAWEELRPAEIGVVLGCTANAAALRLSRARARLRAELTETGPSRTEAGRKDDDGRR